MYYFPTDSTCPQVLWIQVVGSAFRLQGSHFLRPGFPSRSAKHSRTSYLSEPLRYYYQRFGLCRFRSPLLSESRLISLPPPTQMFHFGGFPSLHYFIHVMILDSSSRWFPNSEICGSILIYSSPQLIAVSHVLRRLPMPRHSPYALLRLNNHLLFSNCLSFVQLIVVCFLVAVCFTTLVAKLQFPI